MATPIPILDAADPALEPFRALRERDLVGRQGRFIAEGEVVLKVLLDAPDFAVETALVSQRVAAAGRDWFADLPADAPLHAVDDAVMEGVAGFHVHRGILAIGRRGRALDAAALVAALPARATVLVCIGIANHDNMGGLFRNAAAFGADALLCDASCCDPLYRKAIRVSVGGVFRVPFARGGAAAELIAMLDGAGFDILGLTPAGAVRLEDTVPGPRAALVLGAEGPGLPADVLARIKGVSIGMAEGFDSLNVATAGAIALQRLFNR